MLKKRIMGTLLALSLISVPAAAGAANSNIDKTQLDSGIVAVNYTAKGSAAVKVVVSKGNSKYTYDLKGNQKYPLQSGNGEYHIAVLENVQANKYKVVKQEKVNLKLTNPNEVYLQSIQLINWNKDMNAIKKAEELTKNAKTDLEKVTAIYKYITKNISYDYQKANSGLSGDYIPSIDETLKASKGICYDYAALAAAMLRSVDVPAKLVMGNKTDLKEYHAWNQVYLKESNKWITIDTTYDAIKSNSTMIKNDKDYAIKKVY